MQTVSVSSEAALDSAVNGYLLQGFVVSRRDAQAATLQKQKKFNIGALLLLLIPFLGWAALVIYIAMFAMKPSAQVVTVQVADKQEAAQ